MRNKWFFYKIAAYCLFVFVFSNLALANKIIYVDDDANGTNDGSSWQNAYIYLQDALADANSSEKSLSNGLVEIRVAQGTYKPDKGAGQTAGDREATFELISGVILSGGYAGILEPEPNERDYKKFETILSGDLAGNDEESDNPIISEINQIENSLHIVTNKNTTILEGIVITHGNASYESTSRIANYGGGILNDTGNLTLRNCIICKNKNGGIYNSSGELIIIDSVIRDNSNGGGIYNSKGNIIIQDCVIKGNSASNGGGIANIQGSCSMTNCIIEENSAGYAGGGLFHDSDNLNLTNCIFNKNFTGDEGCGGAIYNHGFAPLSYEQRINNCIFTGNSSGWGGGIYIEYAELFLINCTFIGNTALYEGGGALNSEGGSSVFNNCNFVGNISFRNGGGIGIPITGGSIILNNCKLCGNLALQNGGGIDNVASAPRTPRNIFLNNCLLYGNKAGNFGGGIFESGRVKTSICNSILSENTATHGDQIALKAYISSSVTYSYYSSILFQYSNIQGGETGIYKEYEENVIEWKDGNIDSEPLFANPGYWDPNGTPDDVNDDFWVEGDYHLKSQVGRFDPNSQTWVQDDVTSPCIDAGDPNSPIGLEPFPNGGRINMGAYGGTSEASKSYFGKPVCETIVAGDINGDCKVDIVDLEILLLHWLEEH
jgi:hypothetical protein